MAVKQKCVVRVEMVATDASYSASGRFITFMIIFKNLMRNVSIVFQPRHYYLCLNLFKALENNRVKRLCVLLLDRHSSEILTSVGIV